jgi:hypothetical protein
MKKRKRRMTKKEKRTKMRNSVRGKKKSMYVVRIIQFSL